MDISVAITIIQDEITITKLQMDEIEGSDTNFRYDRWQKLEGQLQLLERIMERILLEIDAEIDGMNQSVMSDKDF